MRPRALGLAGALTAAVAFGAACEPPMEITLNVGRDIVRLPDQDPGQTGPTLLFSGQVYCTRSEPIDLWITLRQGQLEEQAGEHTVDCLGPDGNDWSLVFAYDEAFADGSTGIEWKACTNPPSTVDEDCITVRRASAEIRTK